MKKTLFISFLLFLLPGGIIFSMLYLAWKQRKTKAIQPYGKTAHA